MAADPVAPRRVIAASFGRAAGAGQADPVLFRGREWSELLARPQADRVELRAGEPVDGTAPDRRQLDGLFCLTRGGRGGH